jgi:hypothetical protein
VIIAVVYGFIWIHDIPYQLAKKRNHPNLHAIHVMGWVSLFTLHAIWPFLFLWALAKKPQIEVIVVGSKPGQGGAPGELALQGEAVGAADAAALRAAISQLQARLDKIETSMGGGQS